MRVAMAAHIMRAVLPSTFVIDREAALRARYERQPPAAWTTHLAWTLAGADAGPMRGVAHAGLADAVLPYVVDEAIGGPGDGTTPQDLFLAAVAADLDSTIRRVAARSAIAIDRLAVIVTGDVDVRGLLGAADVPVGFQSIRIEVQLRIAAGQPAASGARLVAIAERGSALVQTLRGGITIELVEA